MWFDNDRWPVSKIRVQTCHAWLRVKNYFTTQTAAFSRHSTTTYEQNLDSPIRCASSSHATFHRRKCSTTSKQPSENSSSTASCLLVAARLLIHKSSPYRSTCVKLYCIPIHTKNYLASVHEPVLQEIISPVVMVCSKTPPATKTIGHLERSW